MQTICRFCTNETVRGRQLCGSCNIKVRRIRTKSAAITYKGGKCTDCGWTIPLRENTSGFDFHHIGFKSFDISRGLTKNWEILKNELDMCILLCRNCHTIRHSITYSDKFMLYALKGIHSAPSNFCSLCESSTNTYNGICRRCDINAKRVGRKIAAINLLGGCCTECGWQGHPSSLDFHHIEDKKFAISTNLHRKWELVLEELKKCILLCSRCHTIKHSDSLTEDFKCYVYDEYVGSKLRF